MDTKETMENQKITLETTHFQTPSLYDVLPKTRLASYQKPDENFEQGFARYQWNLRLAEAMIPCLHYFEVCLRNRINAFISANFGEQWLLTKQPKLLSPEQLHVLDEVIDRYQREKRSHPQQDDLVARMSFGFWISYFHKRFDPILWHRKQAMEKVFPDATNKISRPLIQSELRMIKDVRNRIAHHEPIWDTKPTLIEAHQTCVKLVSALSMPAAKRLNQIDRLEDVWISGVNDRPIEQIA